MPRNDDQLYRCRVCGLLLDFAPWGDSGEDPTFEYCPCCGTEFGYQDSSPEGARRQRERWLQSGATWAEPDEQPDDWDLEAQLAHIAPEWR